jgi:hypothetical protein
LIKAAALLLSSSFPFPTTINQEVSKITNIKHLSKSVLENIVDLGSAVDLLSKIRAGVYVNIPSFCIMARVSPRQLLWL